MRSRDQVIASMLEHNLAAIRYPEYRFFCGCYPNDEATQAAVRGEEFHDRLATYSPIGRQRTETLMEAAREMIEASVHGIAAVAIVQGSLVALGTWIAG